MGLIIIGAAVMASALIPILKLITVLPRGSLKNAWYGLAFMVVAFSLCYFIEAFSHPGVFISWILFFGSIFVFSVSVLSLRVAHIASRIVVLEKENETDPLMKIYNRRYLDTRLRKEFRRSRDLDRPLSILLLDIDRFKRINDRYGHLTGDAVLRQLGPLVTKSIRQSDIVARYGGEEIIIVARDTSNRVASVLADRVRLAISGTTFYSAAENQRGLTPIRVTASVGVATLQPGDHISALVRRADEAMYAAKTAGRNQVVVSDCPVEVRGAKRKETSAASNGKQPICPRVEPSIPLKADAG